MSRLSKVSYAFNFVLVLQWYQLSTHNKSDFMLNLFNFSIKILHSQAELEVHKDFVTECALTTNITFWERQVVVLVSKQWNGIKSNEGLFLHIFLHEV